MVELGFAPKALTIDLKGDLILCPLLRGGDISDSLEDKVNK